LPVCSAFPRPLSDRESALLDLLLRDDFPGVEALRVQRETVRVKGLWRDLGGIVLLEVADAAAPRANVVHTVPVEARVRGADPPREVLLFVKQGALDSIELVDHSGNDPQELPDVRAVEAPTRNVASTDPRQAQSGG
jgi:hypothetical protein